MAETKELTERELNIMAMAWLCFAEQPKPNYEKLADLTGFTNPKSVVNAWSLIKKKLAYKASSAGADITKTAAATTPNTTPRKRGKKAMDEVGESPKKKAKIYNGNPPAATAPSPQDEDDEGEEGNVSDTIALKTEHYDDENEEEAVDEV